LSGLLTEAGPHPTLETIRPVVDFALEHFGPGRLLWGSDWPVATLAADYRSTVRLYRSLTSGLREDEQAAIFGGNAQRVYRLMT
ncbi:MAG: amidohydrolase family protein, partial [Thermomicrobium sp.]|nr:amidohydrolase family protein [Thermomicrobium sp.]